MIALLQTIFVSNLASADVLLYPRAALLEEGLELLLDMEEFMSVKKEARRALKMVVDLLSRNLVE